MNTEIEFNNLVKYIFDKDYKEPYSIQLSLEECGSIKDLFQFLLELFTEGMKLKFGIFDEKKNIVTVNLELLSDNDFKKIKKYYQSFGFDLFYTAIPINKLNEEEYHNNINLTKLSFDKQFIINNNTKLEDLKYKLFTDNFLYTVYFKLFTL